MSPETAIVAGAIFLLVFGCVQPHRKRRRRHGLVFRTVRRVRRRGSLSADYRRYVPNSPEWRAVRGLALDRADNRCERRGLLGRCQTRQGLQAHHEHYRQFGWEWSSVVTPPTWARARHETHGECLTVLCGPHHRKADRRRKSLAG